MKKMYKKPRRTKVSKFGKDIPQKTQITTKPASIFQVSTPVKPVPVVEFSEPSTVKGSLEWFDFSIDEALPFVNLRQEFRDKSAVTYESFKDEYQKLVDSTKRLVSNVEEPDTTEIAKFLAEQDSRVPLLKSPNERSIIGDLVDQDIVDVKFVDLKNQYNDLTKYKTIGELIKELAKNQRSLARNMGAVARRTMKLFDDIAQIAYKNAEQELRKQGIRPTDELITNYGRFPLTGPLKEQFDAKLNSISKLLMVWSSQLNQFIEESNSGNIDSIIASRIFIPTSDAINEITTSMSDFRRWSEFLEPLLPFVFAGSTLVGDRMQQIDAVNQASRGIISQLFPDITAENAIIVSNEFAEELLQSLNNVNLSYNAMENFPNDSKEDEFFAKLPINLFLDRELNILTAFRRGLDANIFLDAQKATNRLINKDPSFKGSESLNYLYVPLQRNEQTEQHYQKFDSLISDVVILINRMKEGCTRRVRSAQLNTYSDLFDTVLDIDRTTVLDNLGEVKATEKFDKNLIEFKKSPIGKLDLVYRRMAKKASEDIRKNPLDAIPSFRKRLMDLVNERKRLVQEAQGYG